MAEQLALEDGFGDRRTVERHEGLARPRAEIVQAARDLFLAAAGIAPDQHIDVGAGQLQHLAAQVVHGAGNAQQHRFDTALAGELLAQLAVFADQSALVLGAAHAVQQAFGCEGLLDEIIGALTQRLHRHGHVAMAGDHDHRQFRVQRDQAFQQAEAVQVRHAHVADQHAGKVPVDQAQRFACTGAGAHAEPGQLQPLLHRFADCRFVVDEDYLAAHVALLYRWAVTRQRGLRRRAAAARIPRPVHRCALRGYRRDRAGCHRTPPVPGRGPDQPAWW